MWVYNGQQFTVDMIGDYYGFVYLITNKLDNRKYIGKKFFTKAGTKQVKGKRKKIRKDSDWETYYGSNKNLIEDVLNLGAENFIREILYLCKTRSECAYWETHEIFVSRALLSRKYYNDWVMVRVRKDHLKQLLQEEEKT
jgi:hypothetical protein